MKWKTPIIDNVHVIDEKTHTKSCHYRKDIRLILSWHNLVTLINIMYDQKHLSIINLNKRGLKLFFHVKRTFVSCLLQRNTTFITTNKSSSRIRMCFSNIIHLVACFSSNKFYTLACMGRLCQLICRWKWKMDTKCLTSHVRSCRCYKTWIFFTWNCSSTKNVSKFLIWLNEWFLLSKKKRTYKCDDAIFLVTFLAWWTENDRLFHPNLTILW